jgi:hypothetical protein
VLVLNELFDVKDWLKPRSSALGCAWPSACTHDRARALHRVVKTHGRIKSSHVCQRSCCLRARDGLRFLVSGFDLCHILRPLVIAGCLLCGLYSLVGLAALGLTPHVTVIQRSAAPMWTGYPIATHHTAQVYLRIDGLLYHHAKLPCNGSSHAQQPSRSCMEPHTTKSAPLLCSLLLLPLLRCRCCCCRSCSAAGCCCRC